MCTPLATHALLATIQAAPDIDIRVVDHWSAKKQNACTSLTNTTALKPLYVSGSKNKL